MSTSTLKNIVLVGKLSITNWEAKKKAKSVEAKAESDNGAKHGTISARKALLPGAEALDAIIKHAAGMRTWWNQVSAPWFDNGMRVYNVAGHMDIQQAFGDMARYRDQLVQQFLDEYPALREKARFDLNDLFDEQEYPTPAEVASRFTCTFEVMPLPDTSDIRVVQGIDEAELDRLQAEAEAKANTRIQAAISTTVSRVMESLQVLASRLQSYTENEAGGAKGNRYYESWVENVKEMAALLPQLNLTNDPRLEGLDKVIMDTFSQPAGFYRDNFEARQTATQKANELSRRLASLFAPE